MNNYSKGLYYYRVILSFLIIKNVIFYFPMANELFGSNAIMPMNVYKLEMTLYLPNSLVYPFQYPYAPHLLLLITFFAATMFLFGIWRFISGFLLYYCIMMFKIRNGFILDGSDNVMQVTLPLLIIAESFQDKFIIKNKYFNRLRNYTNADIFLGALKLQVCLVYFFTAFAKMQGDLWINGTAIYYTMRVKEFIATSWNIPLTENHYFVVLGTYFTILFEIAFPFLIWFKRTKYWVIAAGILLHIGIWVFMRIDNFSWIMIGTYFIFIDDKEYNSIISYFTRPRLLIYYDSWCPKCKKFVSFVKKTDIFGNINYKSVRDVEIDENIIDSNRALIEMPSIIMGKDTVYYGFESLVNISKKSFSLWIFFPILYIFKISGIGNIMYKEIAQNRKLLHCDEEECKII